MSAHDDLFISKFKKEKMMYKLIVPKLLGALIFGLTVLGLLSMPAQPALAATCSGTGCNGTNPHSTGCDANATNVAVIYPASSKVELRRSLICDTLWTRTKNRDPLNRSFYAYATLKFYSSVKEWRNSTAPIPKNAVIYTNQRYEAPPVSQGWKACGYVGYSYKSYPVTSPCTG